MRPRYSMTTVLLYDPDPIGSYVGGFVPSQGLFRRVTLRPLVPLCYQSVLPAHLRIRHVVPVLPTYTVIPTLCTPEDSGDTHYIDVVSVTESSYCSAVPYIITCIPQKRLSQLWHGYH